MLLPLDLRQWEQWLCKIYLKQTEIKNEWENTLGDWQHSCWHVTQDMLWISVLRNTSAKIQWHGLVYMIKRIAYTMKWISLFRELVHTTIWVSVFNDMS